MLNSLTTESTKRGSSVTSSIFAPIRPQLLMNPTASAKPKAKFSSRNLSAVFKAPVRTKPLPDNATGPLQRPNSRMLVLGRAAVAPPAPLNTPSLKRESQVHDVRVSLVPASSNWAESAEKELKPEEDEAPPAPANVVAPTVNPEEVWTPESVAEHLHTASVPVCPKVTVESSGRWGDDAVEHDIVQNNIRRQKQKEREFPDLKEAVDDAQMHHSKGHTPAADRSPSLEAQQPVQRHGRATGRWVQFNEQETHRPMQDDRWSHDRYGRREDDRWSRDRYGRDEEDRWARDRYSRDDDDRWSRGRWPRHDDDNRREQRPFEASNNVILPVPNDRHTHFSRSDARFDMVAFGDQDHVLCHSPHRMDWSSGRFGRRDERSVSPAPPNEPENSRAHPPQPNRSLSQSPVSPSPALKSPPMTAGVASARATKWRNLSSPDHGSDTARGNSRQIANNWSKDEQPSTPVAEVAESSTESSFNSSASCISSPPQQFHLLKRPKMLFDPKTGGMVNAEDKAGSGKRQAGNRGQDRENRDASTTSGSTRATKSSDGKPDSKAKSVETVKTEDTPAAAMLDNASTSSAIVVNSVQVAVVENKTGVSEASTSVSSNAVLVAHTAESEVDVVSKKGRNSNRDRKHAPAKHPAQREADSIRGLRSANARNTQLGRHNRDFAADALSRTNSTKVTERGKRSSSTRSDRRDTSGNKPTQRRSSRKVEVMPTQQSKVVSSELALLKQIAEGSSGDVVVLTNEQEGIEVSREEDGFETVKSRRVVLSEKKLLRQRLASTEAAVQKADEKKSTHALVEGHNYRQSDEQSKGEEVQENFSMATKVVDTQPTSKSRGKPATSNKSRDNAVQTIKDKKTKFKQTKQSARTSGPKGKEYKQVPAKTAVESEKASRAEAKQPVSHAKPTEQVAGEAPAESPISKKRPHYGKVVSTTDTQQGLKPRSEKQTQGNSTRRSSDRKASTSSATGSKRTQTHSNWQGAERTAGSADRVVKKVSTAKPRDPVAKARPKQVRQVYVVKTPAPSTAASGATSTAA